ncbi:hypothetical protein XELAEV_18035600mg [Xenopus laevis]|uniref:Uncharacterized protein n=1 Tax=Xenopus laevis TaxID=8355 RepID=A0A974HC86_XENLA|nr:hypothetical protein XELAEV_18035600mg [Xenopus laevis]
MCLFGKARCISRDTGLSLQLQTLPVALCTLCLTTNPIILSWFFLANLIGKSFFHLSNGFLFSAKFFIKGVVH